MDGSVPPPRVVEYDPVTGIPSEFNEYLPQSSDEYKRYLLQSLCIVNCAQLGYEILMDAMHNTPKAA